MGIVIDIVICLLLTAFSPAFAEIDCEKDVHEICPESALSEDAIYGPGSLQEKFLVEHCSDILEEMSCRDDYLRTCDPDNYRLYSLVTHGAINLLTNLCNETSDIRKGFRQNVDCLQRKSTKLRTCIFIAMESTQRRTSYFGFGQNNPQLQQIARLCKFQEYFRSCSINVAKIYCGKGAGKYLSSVYDILIQDLVSEMC